MFSGPRTGSRGPPSQEEYFTKKFFHLLGVLVLQKGLKILSCVFLEEEQGPCPNNALLLPGLCIPSIPWLENAFWNSGKVMAAEAYSLKLSNEEHRKASVPRNPTETTLIDTVPYAIQQDLMASHSKCKGLQQLSPNSQSFPHAANPLCQPGICFLVNEFLFCGKVHWCPMLDFRDKWEHMVFVFFYLIYFTKYEFCVASGWLQMVYFIFRPNL